jgi:hypothetical protein
MSSAFDHPQTVLNSTTEPCSEMKNGKSGVHSIHTLTYKCYINDLIIYKLTHVPETHYPQIPKPKPLSQKKKS